MSGNLCLPFSNLSRKNIQLAGGKGANLGEMVQAGLPVPPGFVICAPAFRLMMETSQLDTKVSALLENLDRNNCNELKEVEKLIRDLVESTEIAEDLREEILESYQALGEEVPVAVRSSGTAEDLANASFAGQQDTCLNIAGEEALLGSVRRCWSSLYTAQAIYYRCQKGFSDVEVSMAVVVQMMINAEKSGVTFTVEPVTRNPYQMLIEGVWGLGEGIVSGAITPDHYKVDRDTHEILFEFTADKTVMYCLDSQSGVCTEDVPPEKARRAVLTPDELRTLVDLGNQVEDHFGYPQDIEWAIEGGKIYLLQSRPITCL